jgi:uncharacterized protein (DUF58 family)
MSGALTAAGLGVALVLCGAGFDSPSLLVAGVGLLALAVAAIVWVGLARPRRLVREPGPARIIEGEPYPLRLRAEGARVPPPAGVLADSLLERPIAVGPRWRGSFTAAVQLTGRGRRHLAPARLEVRDPLGLRTVALVGEDPGDLLVLPRIEPVLAAGRGGGGARAASLTGLEDGAAVSRLDARAIELEVDGLRAYREGSPASRIHWPAVARTGELIERRLVAGADAAPLVVLDASEPASGEALDAAVRAAASLCFSLAQAGGCAALLPGDRRATELDPDLRTWAQVHARLALAEPGGRPPAIGRAARAGVLFWVTAAARPALPPSLRAGVAARYVVAPAGARFARGSGGVAFTVSGCEGHRVSARMRAPARRAA